MLKIFIIQDRQLLIYLMITQKLDLNLFIDQKKMKLKEQDLKQKKNILKITNSSCTSKSRQ